MHLLITSLADDDATAFVEAILRARLCACVNAVRDVAARYHWKGALESGTETLLLMETERAPEEVIPQLAELHPYECPKLIALPVAHAWQAYADWCAAESTPNT